MRSLSSMGSISLMFEYMSRFSMMVSKHNSSREGKERAMEGRRGSYWGETQCIQLTNAQGVGERWGWVLWRSKNGTRLARLLKKTPCNFSGQMAHIFLCHFIRQSFMACAREQRSFTTSLVLWYSPLFLRVRAPCGIGCVMQSMWIVGCLCCMFLKHFCVTRAFSHVCELFSLPVHQNWTIHTTVLQFSSHSRNDFLFIHVRKQLYYKQDNWKLTPLFSTPHDYHHID